MDDIFLQNTEFFESNRYFETFKNVSSRFGIGELHETVKLIVYSSVVPESKRKDIVYYK